MVRLGDGGRTRSVGLGAPVALSLPTTPPTALPSPLTNAPTMPGALSRMSSPKAITTTARPPLTTRGRVAAWGPDRRPARRVVGMGRAFARLLGCTRPVLGARGRTWELRPRRLVIAAIVADRSAPAVGTTPGETVGHRPGTHRPMRAGRAVVLWRGMRTSGD